MLTVDTIRVTPTKFESNIHEYGVDPGQHGMPLYHADIKLDFEQARDGSMLISRIFLNVEFHQRNRRSSIVGSAAPTEELTLAAEL